MKINSPYILQIKSILWKLAVLLLLYSISRVLFYFFNASYFAGISFTEYLRIFFYGIRFDYSAIIQFNLILVLIYLLPFSFTHSKVFRKTFFITFWVVNSFLLLTNFGDMEYFKYTNKRTTADIFKFAAISNDVVTLIPQFIRDFWYIFLLWIASVAAGIWITRSKSLKGMNYSFKPMDVIIMLLVTGTLFITARGFGVKPLRIISAARYVSSQHIPLIINTPFSILHTIQEKDTEEKLYFTDESYQQIYTPLRQYKAYKKRTDNVVIIILESFSHEFIGSLSGKKTYTPFLDSLLNQSLTFENGFANCRKSIEGIPAILAGLPSLTNNSYISSHYAGNRLEALPYILNRHGYTTTFFHGGRNGTMGFDEFSRVAGIKQYFGMNEYKGAVAFDNNWGIFDDEFMQYTAGELNNLKQPFFSSLFTLSSHHPYVVPERYDGVIPKEESPQLRAIRYTDLALRNFFTTASKMPWYRNTLFVIVADHTAKVYDQEYNNPVGAFRIPIAFYHPGNDSMRGRRKDIAQQIDIMPSVIHYLGIEDSFLAFGNSVFSENRKPFAINFLNNIYYYFHNDFMLSFDGENSLGLFNYNTDKDLKSDLFIHQQDTAIYLETHLKATIQDYKKRLKNNRLTYQIN